MKIVAYKGHIYNVLTSVLITFTALCGQEQNSFSTEFDSVHVKANHLVVFTDRVIVVKSDTILYIPNNTKYTIKEDRYRKSQAFYDSLRVKANNNLFMRTLYDFIFVSQKGDSDTLQFAQAEKRFFSYMGKTIASIHIKRLDILSGSVYDTLQVAESGFSRTLNSLHIKTRESVIRNNLLFNVGDTIAPFTLADNERILRNLPYMYNASILIEPHSENDNIVDLIVVTQDVFSIGITPSINSINNYRIRVFDRNFMGLGSEFSNTFEYNANDMPPWGYDGKFAITNIAGSFIRGLFNYINYPSNELIRLEFSRTFFTPQIKYAGGLDWGITTNNLEENEGQRQHITSHYQDIWLGRSFIMGDAASRRNLIIAARYFDKSFNDRPQVLPDSNYKYHDENLILGSITLRNIYYFQSNMILSFGRTEDIPYGYIFNITGGLNQEEFRDKYYLGGSAGAAEFWKNFGYLGINLSAGGYLHDHRVEEGIFKITGTYFTPLIEFSQFHIRNLFYINYTAGWLRLAGETINLKDEIRGIAAERTEGQRKLTFSLESVAFAPWYFYGFRFALYAFSDFGWVTQDKDLISPDHLYGAVGIGCRIRNESLVFNTIQLRFGLFTKSGQFNFNFSLRESRRFTAFEYSKPSVIPFK